MEEDQEVETSSGVEAQESGKGYRDSASGKSLIPPSFYNCPKHGDILAQDVWWDEENRPRCPRGNELLSRKPSVTKTTR